VTMDSFRSVAVAFTEPLVDLFKAFHVSANTLSIVSLGCAALAGLAYYFSGWNTLLLALALLFVLLNGLLDGLDGALARKTGSTSRYGDFLDHVIDRYSDVFIVCGIFLGGYLRADLGAMAVVGILLASYLGTQAQAVGVGRVYGGLMGRADRMVVITLATCLNLVYPAVIGAYGVEFTILGWALLLIGVLSHVTAFQRIWHTRKALLSESGDKK
jgi:phosphatidylglycerophosphate synthase